MANPLFKALGGAQKRQGGFIQQFPEFMRQMKGKNPNDIISQLISSGKISQNQLDAVQQQARQISSLFEPFKGMFNS